MGTAVHMGNTELQVDAYHRQSFSMAVCTLTLKAYYPGLAQGLARIRRLYSITATLSGYSWILPP